MGIYQYGFYCTSFTPTIVLGYCGFHYYDFLLLRIYHYEFYEAYYNQNPHEASSRSRIFLILLAYVCMYVGISLFVYLFVSRLLATLTMIQIWNSAPIDLI